MPYYLGIDGGGTKTTCALGDERRVLATVTAGPSNIVRVGEQHARESLHTAVRQICAAAKITASQIAGTCMGASGGARPEIAATLHAALAEVLSNEIRVVGDMEIALDAAFDTGPGVIVIAGTGSIAYGRNGKGATARAGGWGFAIGDEGSAHWIGREAVRATLRQSDAAAGRGAKLASALCTSWYASSLIDLARMANSNPAPDFASLFPVVAASDDELAGEIQSQAAKELARIASIVMRRLFPAHESEPVPVAMIGGVFRHAACVRERFYNELRQLDARAELHPQVVEPVEGALRMARRMAERSPGT